MPVRTALRPGVLSSTLPVPRSIVPPEYAWKPTVNEGAEPWVQTREVIEKMAETIVHDTSERPSLPPNFSPAPFSEVLLLSDFWSPVSEFRRIIGQLAANGARGHVVQVVDPAEETFPYMGRVEFIEPEGLGSITAGRAETWRSEYQALVANHRAALRAECEQFGWSFTVHRTDRGPTELLFAIHARMGAGAHVVTKSRQPARTGSEAPT